MKVCLKAVTGFYILFGTLQVKRLYFSFCSIACKQTINRKKKKGENFLKTKYLCQSNILEVFFVEKFLMFWDYFFSFKTCTSKEQTDSSTDKYAASTYLQSAEFSPQAV